VRYEVYLTRRAEKQYERLDNHIRRKIKTELSELENEPYRKGFSLLGLGAGLRYIKTSHSGVQYRAVYDISDNKKEVLVIFIGSRENFYKELRKFLG
jgi:mRNA-degrading endonuclease RelE of RelBE toxin-antitoxin system